MIACCHSKPPVSPYKAFLDHPACLIVRADFGFDRMMKALGRKVKFDKNISSPVSKFKKFS